MTIEEHNKEVENLKLLDSWWDLAAKKVEIENLIQIEKDIESRTRLRVLLLNITKKIKTV